MSDDGLEKLRKRLYKKGEQFAGRFQEPELTYRPEKVSSQWRGPEEPAEILAEVLKESRFKKMKIFLWITALFVLGLSAMAVIYLFGGFGSVSSRNIDILISSPEEVAGGDLVRWEVSIHNKNNKGLASADLAFRYPSNSKPISERAGDFLIERISLGEVASGGIAKHTFAAHVFGQENFEGAAEAVLEYRVEGSNAVFEKTKSKPLKIIRSPIGVSVDSPQEINALRETTFLVNYVSNSAETIRKLGLEIAYPSGFTFKEANPRPAEGENRWILGDLAPGTSGTIRVTGIFEGEDLEQKNITARVGISDGKTLSVYGADTKPFVLRRMFVELAARVNNLDSVSTVKVGDFVNVEILWKNNLQQALHDATIEIRLFGEAINEGSIVVSSGSYRGLDKRAVWSPSSLGSLSLLNPGESGRTHLALRILDVISLSRKGLVNPTVKLTGEIKPGRTPEGFEGTDIIGRFEIELKVETNLQLSSRGFYEYPPFSGSGPLPPKVGQETVYAAVWTLANLSNNTSGVSVRASLPSYVNWKGIFSPSDESITYDPIKSEVVWSPGNIEAGVGISRPAREIAFQLGVIPSQPHVRTSPVILFDIIASGRDDFTGGELRDAESSLTTDISKFDSQVRSEMGIVEP